MCVCVCVCVCVRACVRVCVCIYISAHINLYFFLILAFIIFSGCHAFTKTTFLTLHYHSYFIMDIFYLTLQYLPFSSNGTYFLGDVGCLPESPHTRWYQKRFVVLSLRIYPSYSLLFIRKSLYVPSLHTTLAYEPAHIYAEE